jgi:peptide/nickel transport system permease protein
MRVAVYFLLLLVALSIFADFLAGEYPILWKDHDGLEMPVARNYIGKIRYGSKYYLPNEYRDGQADWAIWPAIRYGPSNIDREVGGYVRPLSPGHFLGTDPIGRDVAAGIVHGCRISLTVGVLAVFMAFLAGSFTGMLTAYYGDDKLTMPTPEIVMTILSAPFIGFYAAKVAGLMDPPFSVFAFVLVFIFAYFLLFKLFRRIRKQVPARKMVRIPLDILFMRFMEVFRSLPGLFIILTLLVWVRSPGLWILAGVIALFYWTTFARYIRGELLRLRDLPFVKRFLLEGKSDLSIKYDS